MALWTLFISWILFNKFNYICNDDDDEAVAGIEKGKTASPSRISIINFISALLKVINADEIYEY